MVEDTCFGAQSLISFCNRDDPRQAARGNGELEAPARRRACIDQCPKRVETVGAPDLLRARDSGDALYRYTVDDARPSLGGRVAVPETFKPQTHWQVDLKVRYC